jgi:hypothetical protein
MLARLASQQYLETALSAVAAGPDYGPALDALPVPVYTVDPSGRVTYANPACAAFVGREPRPGADRWCVSWRLYSPSGEPIPHDKCPMATAVEKQRPVRDKIAIAERPDGSRVAFMPFPTPLFDNDGTLTGALNLLIDVTDEQAHALHDQAQRCRRLAGATFDRATNKILGEMADGFDRTAGELAQGRGA